MHIETNRGLIQSWVEAKQRNEQEMLRRLNFVFCQPGALNPMRVTVLRALKQMLGEIQGAPPRTPTPAQRAMWAEKDLAVWGTLVPPVPAVQVERRLERMISRLQGGFAADANDLSELIRVIGAWLEMGGGHGAPDINIALRTGGAWGRDVRQREDRNKPGHAIEPHVAASWVRPKFGKQSGLEMFRVNRNDLCKRIDLLFGLLKGATISGTTTDTVLVLEAFGAGLGLHPGYYLFPVATIAASLHHTLLEAGLALTLTGAIDSYRVGFYSTLVPTGGLPAELASVRGILDAAEKDLRNRHFILWYEGGDESSPAGCILWNRPWEIHASRRMVEATGLLAHISSVPKVPGKADVAALIDLMAPQLLAALPQEFQPQRFRSRA
jgi:hypothetical protein